MRFDVVTLFPQMVDAAARCGVTGSAIERGLVGFELWNPRDYTTDRHRTVDDRPYGGGPGMVMKVEPLRDAIAAARADSSVAATVIHLSPQGKQLNQATVAQLAGLERLILVAGRYEGIDQRLLDSVVDEEWSIGDYVLSGGELAALVMMDAVMRLLPGVLGDQDSAQYDSHVSGLLDHPHYTRPESVEGVEVPAVLLSGDHAGFALWRMKSSVGATWLKRPDLLERCSLEPDQQALLEQFIKAQ